MRLLIRALTPADATAFQALRLHGLQEQPSAFASSYEEEHATPVETVAARLSPKSDRAIFGAFAGEELVGVVGLQREDMKKLAHKAFIWGMYVTPSARKSGVGQKLVEHALDYAASKLAVQQVNLGVNANNRAAIAHYERMGFTQFGFERRFMIQDGVPQDEIHMAVDLSAAT